MTEHTKAAKTKQRLLRLLRYLYENTDEEHPASTSLLAETLYGENTMKKTVRSM